MDTITYPKYLRLAFLATVFSVVVSLFLALPPNLLAAGKIRIESGGEKVGAEQSPIQFVYHDALGLPTKTVAIALPEGATTLEIPEGVSILIGDGPSVQISIAGDSTEVVVEGGDHNLKVAGDHRIEVRRGSVQMAVLGGAPTVKIQEDTNVGMKVLNGSPLLRMGDVASSLKPGAQANFKTQGKDLVVDAIQGKVNLVNAGGGTVVVEENKSSTFSKQNLESNKEIKASATSDLAVKTTTAAGKTDATAGKTAEAALKKDGLPGPGTPPAEAMKAAMKQAVTDGKIAPATAAAMLAATTGTALEGGAMHGPAPRTKEEMALLPGMDLSNATGGPKGPTTAGMMPPAEAFDDFFSAYMPAAPVDKNLATALPQGKPDPKLSNKAPGTATSGPAGPMMPGSLAAPTTIAGPGLAASAAVFGGGPNSTPTSPVYGNTTDGNTDPSATSLSTPGVEAPTNFITVVESPKTTSIFNAASTFATAQATATTTASAAAQTTLDTAKETKAPTSKSAPVASPSS